MKGVEIMDTNLTNTTNNMDELEKDRLYNIALQKAKQNTKIKIQKYEKNKSLKITINA